MAEYIDSITLSKLRGINILEVADALGIGLRHRNALCISHNDSNPSLHFWPSTNTCHCFACGWGGDNIDLVMKRENLSFTRNLPMVEETSVLLWGMSDSRQGVRSGSQQGVRSGSRKRNAIRTESTLEDHSSISRM